MEAVAKLNNCPTSPRKMRMVVDTIRGVNVYHALKISLSSDFVFVFPCASCQFKDIKIFLIPGITVPVTGGSLTSAKL